MDAADAHERLDRYGWLDASHGEGVYALRLSVPDAPRDRWLDTHTSIPEPDPLPAITNAERLCYVGKATYYAGAAKRDQRPIYDRIMDHAKATVRQTTICPVFPPCDIVGVWNDVDPVTGEWNIAHDLAGAGTVCWTDGELVT